jgi:hypothetical protein
MVARSAPVVRRGDDGGKRDADSSAGMSEARKPLNDNTPFDEKAWRKEYMKLYMRKKRERLREAKRNKEQQASGL